LYFPEFRLPALEERKRILRFSDDADKAHFEKCRSKKCRDCKGGFQAFRSDIPPCDVNAMSIPANAQKAALLFSFTSVAI
jgi:hypothetical protein